MKIGFYISSLVFLLTVLSSTNVRCQQDTSCVGAAGTALWYVYPEVTGIDMTDLYEYSAYPLSPTYELPMLGIESTTNFSNDYGSVLRGFIKIPETGDYTFNVTGNNAAHFYLSEGTDPTSMALTAYTESATGKEEHNKFPTQTSTGYRLNEGNYYYFELHHKEGMYGDHATVYWKTPLYQDTLWRLVNSSYVYQYSCFSTCPTEGTPCDDGNPNTINDIEDGYCNCYGEASSSNNCVGPRGEIYAMFYDSISGGGLSGLYNASKFPLEPDTAILLPTLRTPVSFMNEYGTLVRGYIRVPEDGAYVFNVTGDDDTRFYLSSDDDSTNLALIAEVDGWTNVGEHYKFPSQTSSTIALSASEFYYFELHHKEGGGGDHASVYWKPPTRPDTNWVTIQSIYLYGYDQDCEMACVPAGTPCNDYDPTTENDQFDDNCDCVGTPCGGPCDEMGWTDQPLCAPSGGYSDNEMDSWLSCETAASPNPVRGNSHFILYDFGTPLKIERNHYWNYNVKNQTAKGAKTVTIDYATNTNNWQNLGTFSWDEAPGTPGYTGDSIPEINNIRLRYLLFTIVETWGDTCAGFSEILFDVRRCRAGGTPCDDGDPTTHGDMYDNDCNCVGIPELLLNPCDSSILIVDDPVIVTDDYNADLLVRGEVGKVEPGNTVTFTSAQTIELEDGFEVELGSHFYASIEPCTTPLAPITPTLVHRVDIEKPVATEDGKEYLSLGQSGDARRLTISFRTGRTGPVELTIQNDDGRVYDFYSGQELSKGSYEKRMPVQALKPGIYYVHLTTRKNHFIERFVVSALD